MLARVSLCYNIIHVAKEKYINKPHASTNDVIRGQLAIAGSCLSFVKIKGNNTPVTLANNTIIIIANQTTNHTSHHHLRNHSIALVKPIAKPIIIPTKISFTKAFDH
jgi:hypothetical protein